jgi:hypothetical protein
MDSHHQVCMLLLSVVNHAYEMSLSMMSSLINCTAPCVAAGGRCPCLVPRLPVRSMIVTPRPFQVPSGCKLS